jgi:AhpD family alkylhydroperoxidase
MKQRFADFMGAVNAEGAVSTREKQLMAIALSLLAKCEPCVKLHIDKSRKIGLSEEEIEEAVWMAISFGGAPIMMFYNSIRKQI